MYVAMWVTADGHIRHVLLSGVTTRTRSMVQ